MSEKLEGIRDKAGGAMSWMSRHKVWSAIIVLLAVSMVYNAVFAENPLGASATVASGAAETPAQSVPAQTARAFMAEYGTYSYIDALDARELAKTAHRDLVAAVIDDRIAENLLPGEEPDQGLAQARMAEKGLVKVTSPTSLTLSPQEDGGYQVTVVADESVFTVEKGIVKTQATYLIEMKKATEAGTGSPYQVTRIFKQS